MSFEQVPQKAESNAAEHERPAQGSVQAPGKSAKPPDKVLPPPAKALPAHTEMAGSAYADEGLACDGGKGEGDCFLDAGTRQRVVNLFHGRVNAAHLAYMSALTQLGIEELLKKEPEKSEWVMELLLDVIGAVTSNVALKIFRLAIGGHHVIEGVAAASAADVSHGLTSHGDELFKEGFGMAVTLGKKEAAAPHHTDPSKPEAGTEKAVNVGYIDMLKDQSGLIFEQIREDMIAGIDDARLLVLFDSFRAVNHTVSAYKTALSQKLQRFTKSGVGKLGIKNNDEIHGPLDSYYAPSQYERHVYWVRMPGGNRLGLYKRGYKASSDTVREITGADRMKTPQEKQADKKAHDSNDGDFIFETFVPNEFVDAAVKMHAAKWGWLPRERDPGPYEVMQMGAKEEQP